MPKPYDIFSVFYFIIGFIKELPAGEAKLLAFEYD